MKNTMCVLAGVLLSAGTVNAETVVLSEFDVIDHIQGGIAPPSYALRLDNIFFGTSTATFSANVYNNATLAVVQDTVTNDIYIDIQGTFHGGEDLGDSWGTTFDLDVNFRYEANVAETADGWVVTGFSTLNVGTITRLDTNETVTWYGMEDVPGDNGPAGEAFRFAADGWRIDNDDSSWVGRGWMTMNDDGSESAAPAQDWFFSAIPVPAPSSLALLGLGGLAATRRRR